MKTLLITGATGFIGSHFTRQALAAGWRVALLATPHSKLDRLADVAGELEVHRAELDDAGAVRQVLDRVRPSACAHIGWYMEPGKNLASLQNIACLNGSLTLMRELARCGCTHMVSAGTCFEYRPTDGPLSEDSAVGPETLYASSKLSLCLAGGQLAEELGMRLAWARIFHVYGPDEDPQRVLPAVVRALDRGQPFQASAGTQVRDYMHVADAAGGLLAVLESGFTGIINVCTGQGVRIRELVEKVGEVMGRRELIQFGAMPPRSYEPAMLLGDNGRISSLGWQPRFDLQSGVCQTVEWWLAHRDRLELGVAGSAPARPAPLEQPSAAGAAS